MTPAETIDAQPCVKCGEFTLSILEVATNDTVIGEAFICRSCQGPALQGYREAQRQFAQLLAMGCDREQANRIMVKRIDRCAR